MSAIKFYTNYNVPPKVKKEFKEDDEFSVSVTKQCFAAECDINRIVDKFPVVDYESVIDSMDKELFGKIVSADEMSGALQVVDLVNSQFMSMPAKFRDEFGNDPIKFLEYLDQPGAIEKLEKEGLIQKTSKTSLEPSIEPSDSVSVDSSRPDSEEPIAN